MDNYTDTERLLTLLRGLKCKDIENLMHEPPSMFFKIGSAFSAIADELMMILKDGVKQ